MCRNSLLSLCLLALVILACQSASPTPIPTAAPAPTATAIPTPVPSAVSEQEAEATSRKWAIANLPQLRSEIGRSIGSMAGTVQSVSVDLKATILESSQEWESGQADTEVNWVGAKVDLGEDGA